MAEGIYVEKPKQSMKFIKAAAMTSAERGVIHLFEYVLEPQQHFKLPHLFPQRLPVPLITETAMLYHYDIINMASKKWAHPFPLCAAVGSAGTYTSAVDGIAAHTVTSSDDQDSAVYLTEIQLPL